MLIILDRDGVVVRDVGYLSDLNRIRINWEFFEYLKKAFEHFNLVLITNQSGIKRGFFSLQKFQMIQREIENRLRREGIRFKEVYFCPHHPNERCGCRKPNIWLLKKAMRILREKNAILIGDKLTDLEAAQNVGIPGIMFKQKYFKSNEG